LIDVEEFHAQSERGVKQELFAHFVLITLNRIFANHAEDEINERDESLADERIATPQPLFRINIKNALVTMARNLESLFLQQAKWITQTLNHIIDANSFCKQKERPGRKHERVSKKPVKKWRPSKSKPAIEMP
jgi:hypothetical protein